MATGVRVSTQVIRAIVGAAAAFGVAPAALLARVGLDAGAAGDPDGWVPLEVENALWEAAAELAGEAAFGLHAAQRLEPGTFGVLDYALRSSATVREALARLVRYNRLTHEVASFAVQAEGARARLVHGFGAEPLGPSRHASEFTLATVVLVTGQLIGRPWQPQAVRFIHAAPPDIAPHRAIFGDDLAFEQPQNEVVFEASFLDTPLVSADPGLAAVLDQHAALLLERLPQGADFVQRLRGLVANELSGGNPTIEHVAGRLGMSPRTLQRTLAEQGTTYQDVVEGVRQQLARRLLAERTVAIAAVAFLLGYSEPSAFHRAYKRWTGQTPAAWRRAAG